MSSTIAVWACRPARSFFKAALFALSSAIAFSRRSLRASASRRAALSWIGKATNKCVRGTSRQRQQWDGLETVNQPHPNSVQAILSYHRILASLISITMSSCFLNRPNELGVITRNTSSITIAAVLWFLPTWSDPKWQNFQPDRWFRPTTDHRQCWYCVSTYMNGRQGHEEVNSTVTTHSH